MHEAPLGARCYSPKTLTLIIHRRESWSFRACVPLQDEAACYKYFVPGVLTPSLTVGVLRHLLLDPIFLSHHERRFHSQSKLSAVSFFIDNPGQLIRHLLPSGLWDRFEPIR